MYDNSKAHFPQGLQEEWYAASVIYAASQHGMNSGGFRIGKEVKQDRSFETCEAYENLVSVVQLHQRKIL